MNQKYRIYTIIILVMATVLIAGCSNAQTPKTQDIEIDVSEGEDIIKEDEGTIPSDEKEEARDSDLDEKSSSDKDSDPKEIKELKNSTKDQNSSTRVKEGTNKSMPLTKLLPHREGYKWVYDGSVEYGHKMVLESIDRDKNKIVYKVDGEVDDMSDGESKGDFSIGLIYTLTKDNLVQTVDSEMMMDSEFPQIELMRLPLTKGSKWTQKQKNTRGETVTLESSIDEIENDGEQKIYTVTYKDKNSNYYEKRKIKEGVGVISFEHLFTFKDNGKEESMPMGYAINNNYSGYLNNLSINKFLPPLNREIVYFGLAEYGHKGSLKRMSATSDFAEYQFDAIYNDGSGIEDRFKVQYNIDYIRGTVTEKVLSNTRDNKKEVNSKLQPLVILKTPFTEGNSWSHKVGVDGKDYNVSAVIKEVDDKKGQLVVEYRVKDVPGYFENTYIEERTFEMERGMIGFKNLLPGDIGIDKSQAKDSKLLEEAIINHMFGYGTASTK